MLGYNAIRGFKEPMTLPTVQSYGTNNNILRDPPKSVFTRKIDRVGSNNNLLQEMNGSEHRIREMINPYARGVNPHIEVEFGNHGQGGGLTSISGTQSKLPYRVLNNGAFRLPSSMFEQRNVLPLSRLPRGNTSATTNKQDIRYAPLVNPDYVKEASSITPIVGYNTVKTGHLKDGYVNSDYKLTKNVPNYSMASNQTFFTTKEGFRNTDLSLFRNTPGYSIETNKVDSRIDLSNEKLQRNYTKLRDTNQFGGRVGVSNVGDRNSIIRHAPVIINRSIKNDMSTRHRAAELMNSYSFN